MYGIYLDANDRVILVVDSSMAIPEKAIFSETIPDGQPMDYLYQDGEFVYSPLPQDEPGGQTDAQRLDDVEKALALLLSGAPEEP